MHFPHCSLPGTQLKSSPVMSTRGSLRLNLKKLQNRGVFSIKGAVCLLLLSWTNSYSFGVCTHSCWPAICPPHTHTHTFLLRDMWLVKLCTVPAPPTGDWCLCLSVDNDLTSLSMYTALLTQVTQWQKVSLVHGKAKALNLRNVLLFFIQLE